MWGSRDPGGRARALVGGLGRVRRGGVGHVDVGLVRLGVGHVDVGRGGVVHLRVAVVFRRRVRRGRGLLGLGLLLLGDGLGLGVKAVLGAKVRVRMNDRATAKVQG